MADEAAQETIRRAGQCCDLHIKIGRADTINVYNCPPQAESTPSTPPEECPPPQGSTGACVPVGLGSKHKTGMERKLQVLVENNPVPSVLAAAVMHQTRRYVKGRSPGNQLEASVFEILKALPQYAPGILRCAVDTFDALPREQRDRLFDPDILNIGDRALSPEEIVSHFTTELDARAAHFVFGDDGCTEERPGIPRPIHSTINGGAFLGFIPSIWRVNNLRTVHFEPRLGVGDREPEELQQVCTPEVINGEVVVNCEVQTENCDGHRTGGADSVCLRVPEVRAGDAVVLEGVNFFNIDATVRLTAKDPGTAVAEVDAFVCGDQDTPATEQVDGNEFQIVDSRVHDRLTFSIPDELAGAVYEARVAVPNNTGVADTDPVFVSEPVYIRVVPPDTAVFQVSTETLHADQETSPSWAGSDEVGLRFLAIPVFTDGTFGSMDEPIDIRLGNVDSGDTRDISRTLIQESNLAGISIGVFGFEIDSERAFREQIESVTEAFVDIVKRIWEEFKEELGAAAGFIIKKFGWWGLIGVLIAAAVIIVISAIVALWAPADPIIEDTIALSSIELAALSSANFPSPSERSYTTTQGIDVTVVPVSKSAEYRERREYRSDDEDSSYHINLRYSRLS